MGFYDNHILPKLIDLSCGVKPVRRQREKVVPLAEGRVLEVGIGSGLNIEHYNPDKVEMVWGLEPSEGMRRKAWPRVRSAPFRLEWLDLPGEEIPLDDNTADTIVMTYTLCTIPAWKAALEQMRRVLKPGGKLLFSEHGAAPDETVKLWQDRINPIWKRLAGGCNLNRDIPRLLRDGGFDVRQLETMYMPSTPRIAGFTYWGYAA